MQSNRLQLNTNKSELLWCATARRRQQLPSCPFMIGPDTIIPSTVVRDLGIYIDSDRCISSDLSRVALQSYVSYAAFDYGNATLACLQTSLLNRLQSAINAAARSIAGLRRSEHM